jgi:hypothetical protein
MTRLTLAAAGAALALAACSTSPDETADRYLLAAIDGQSLPAPSKDLPDGYFVLAATLDFDPGNGLVRYTQTIRDTEQQAQTSSVDLEFTRTKDSIAINLCPPLALCILRTELVGTATSSSLVLTHILGAEPRSTYRFERRARPR